MKRLIVAGLFGAAGDAHADVTTQGNSAAELILR
jgi:hypothetical protein